MADGLILITGSSGLIGAAVAAKLAEAGMSCLGIDLRAPQIEDRIDIRDIDRLAALLQDVTGIIHLAAVSRVIHGQDDPDLCHAVNAGATRAILHAALAAARRPWLLYASSREVYGQQDSLPVSEDAAFRPLNAYARSKVDAEGFVNDAREASLQTAIVRFSSVYGSVDDHRDRVVPAFVAAAVHGGILRVDGIECGTDFTHVDDVANGVARVVEILSSGERMLPPIHFVSGRRTNLLDLAQMAIAIGGARGSIRTAAARTFDVHSFVGDPGRAKALLGWQATIGLHEGLSRLARDFRQCA
jgi:nucleoside-diphosphate-sugar epimerase